MKILFIIVFLCIFDMINTGCPKSCIQANYSFTVNSQIRLDIDSIHVGDTLFLTSNFPTNLMDQRSGKIIDYSNASDIESTLSIAQLMLGDSIPKGSVYDFKYNSQLGMIYNATNIPGPE